MPRPAHFAFAYGSVLALSLSLAALFPASAGAQTPPAASAVAPVRTVVIQGEKVISESVIRKAAEQAVVGKPSAEDARRAAVTAVRALYRRRGYTMAQVVDAEISETGTLTLRIAEGVIRRIVIRGNRKTRERTIRHALSVKTGDVYKESDVSEERRRLARLGIFADIRIAPRVPGTDDPALPDLPKDGEKSEEQTPKKETPPPPAIPLPAEPAAPGDAELGDVDLFVTVRDGDTAGVQASVGYADGIGAVGFLDLSENNLFGTGQQAQILWQRTVQASYNSDGSISNRDARSAAAFSYAAPALNRNDLAFGVAVYDNNTIYLPLFAGVQETLRTYERRRGARARIGREILRDVTGYLTVRRDQIGYDNVPDYLSPPFGVITASTGTIGALGANLVADGRNSQDFPTHGYRASVRYENASQVFGGDLPFAQTEADLRFYVPFGKPNRDRKDNASPVLATRLLGGFSHGDVPLPEQFYLGGYELLRGYDLFAFHGANLLLATAEIRIPLSDGLQGVAFSDYGAAWNGTWSFDPGRFRASAGVGIRFATPIGPIRLDAAYGSKLQTYISLGQSF